MRAPITDLYSFIKAERQRRIEELAELEQYIAGIEDEFVRQIFIYRFVDGLTWSQIPKRLGIYHAPNTLAMMVKRYIERH